jgi:hypothetical protein
VFEAWAARGIAVFSLDHHGMGASEPHEPAQRLLVQSMGHLVRPAPRRSLLQGDTAQPNALAPQLRHAFLAK